MCLFLCQYCTVFITVALWYSWKSGSVWVSESCSVMSDSLRPHGLYSPWNSPGQNTGVGSYSLLQGIFPTQGWSPGLPHCRQILYQLREAWKCVIPPALFFFLRITLAIWGRLWFTINVRIFSYFCGEYYWYFDGDCIEFIAILVILILLIHEYRYFSICCVFYFFSVVLQFLLCRSFISLVKFFPKYFIVLMLLWKGSFYFFSYILSLVNRQKNGLLLIDVIWCNFTDIID